MAVEHLTGTVKARLNYLATENLKSIPQHIGPVVVDSVVEVSASASDTSTYWLARIPTRARIHGCSVLRWDVLSTGANAPTMDVGLYAVNANVTSDVDALADGLDVEDTASTQLLRTTHLPMNPANVGKMAWELVANVTEDPGGWLDIKCVLDDFDIDDGGTISLSLMYTVD
jgi:hypothetical protein